MMGEQKPIGRNSKRNCKKHELTNNEHSAVLQSLLEISTDRVLKRGTIKQVADEFKIERNTVGRLWSWAVSSSTSKFIPMDVSSRKFCSGQKKKDFSLQLEQFPFIPLRKRSTLRSAAAAAAAIGIPMTTLYNRMKAGEIRPYSNTVKPLLTDENKTDRVQFCLQHLDKIRFTDMFDVDRVDEKWFYMTKNTRKFYLGKNEADPGSVLSSVKTPNYEKKVPEFNKNVPEFNKNVPEFDKKHLKKPEGTLAETFEYNNKDKDNSPNNLDNTNNQASSQNFRKILIL